MDIFKLGLRNILGITIPGTILLLVSYYFLFVINKIFTLNLDMSMLQKQQWIAIILFFLLSFFIGSITRLFAADMVDDKSSRYWNEKFRSKYLRNRIKTEDSEQKENTLDDEKEINEFIDAIKNGGRELEDIHDCNKRPKGIDDWLWRNETFPYSVYMFREFKRYYPEEMYDLFLKKKEKMGIGKDTGKGKQFLNYCKMVVFGTHKHLGDYVIQEIISLEAIVRFNAGTYYGLFLSFVILIHLLIIQLICTAIFYLLNAPVNGQSYWANADLRSSMFLIFTTTALLTIIGFTKRMIIPKFRLMRLKEVEGIYTAYYFAEQSKTSGPTQ